MNPRRTRSRTLRDIKRRGPLLAVAAAGLLKYQPKAEPSNRVAAAKQIVPAEKADAIVVMLGLQDRTSIREAAPDPKNDPKAAADKKKADAAKSDAAKPDAAKPGDA